MSDFFKDILKELKDEDTHMAGDSSAEFSDYMDTGCYTLNALMSGSIYKGLPNTKRLMLAGVSSVGKTFFQLGIIKEHLNKSPNNGVVLYDTESAITRQMLVDRDIDPSRVIIVDVQTIQKFRTHVLRFTKAFLERKEKDRPNMLMILDSLGNLSTEKEVADIEAGKDTRDMTRSQLIRGCFRAITVPLARAKIPMILTNHTYAGIGGLFPTEELSGGGGARYAADIIVMLSKAQDKDGQQSGPVVGSIITAKNFKNRFAKEKASVKLRLRYESGLDKYYGLLEIAERGGLISKVSNKYEMPDGTRAFEKAIYKNPEKYFTQEFLDDIDKVVGELFQYGGSLASKADEVLESSDDDDDDGRETDTEGSND